MQSNGSRIALMPTFKRSDLSEESGGSVQKWMKVNKDAASPLWVVNMMFDALKQQVGRLNELTIENRALRARVTGLESRAAKGVGGIRWAGTFEPGSEYREGEVVTGKGGLWLACATTTAAPGTDPTSWRLILRAKTRDAEE